MGMMRVALAVAVLVAGCNNGGPLATDLAESADMARAYADAGPDLLRALDLSQPGADMAEDPSCGHDGQACCADHLPRYCYASGSAQRVGCYLDNASNAYVCRLCGGLGQGCCREAPGDCGDQLSCDGDVCEDCGFPGQRCCNGDYCVPGSGKICQFPAGGGVKSCL